MEQTLAGQAALVTGSTSGIGLAIAQFLHRAGAKVMLNGFGSAEDIAAARASCGDAPYSGADMSKPGEVRAMVAEAEAAFGRLDILVNNAGTNIRRRPEEVSDEDWATVMDTNLTSLMRLTRGAHPLLKAHGVGRVINVASIMALFGLPFSPAYAASKGAVVQYTKVLATAWAGDGITANAVLPGWIETELTDRARTHQPGLYERQIARTPAGRWGTPDDLGGIAAFLASDAAGFVTGAAIPVDGGFAAMG